MIKAPANESVVKHLLYLKGTEAHRYLVAERQALLEVLAETKDDALFRQLQGAAKALKVLIDTIDRGREIVERGSAPTTPAKDKF